MLDARFDDRSRSADDSSGLDEHNATRYAHALIQSFADRTTEDLWAGRRTRGIDPRIVRAARIRLRYLDVAVDLNALRVPPGNRLERLRGDRFGQYGIRVNDQWRLCFRWSEAGPTDVELVDYHR